MKKFEMLAIVLIVLLFLSRIPNPLFSIILSRLYGPTQVGQYSMIVRIMASASGVIGLLVNIGIGIWLFILARRENATPWIWLLFGLVFSISAAILFFLLKIYQSIRPSEATNTLPNPDL